MNFPFSPERPKVGKTLKFLFLPNFKRSLMGISTMGGLFVQLVALLLADTKLVPKTHPVVTGQEKGIRALFDLVREAGRNVKFDKAHAPQTALFFAIIGSLTFLVMTALTLLLQLTLGIGSAFAQTAGQSSSMFLSPAGNNDLALQWIRDVFGTDGAQAAGTDQRGISFLRGALVTMLSFYSSGVLVLASIVLLYYLVRMVVETAHHGVPFGKSHNMVWSPIRLVFALMLLIPVGGGLNTGQYMVLNIARWGSGLGSNAWVTFASALGNNKATLAAMPVPSPEQLIEDVTVSVVCTNTLNKITRAQQDSAEHIQGFGDTEIIVPKMVKDNGDDVETFGTPSNPFRCGGIRFKRVDTGSAASSSIYNAHIQALTQIVDKIVTKTKDLSTLTAFGQGYSIPKEQENANLLQAYKELDIPGWEATYIETVQKAVQGAVSTSSGQSTKMLIDQVTRTGWVSAGFYFPTLARMNEQFASAVVAIPETEAPQLDTNVFSRLLGNNSPDTQTFRVVDFVKKAIEAHKADQNMVASNLMSSTAMGGDSFLDTLLINMLDKAGMSYLAPIALGAGGSPGQGLIATAAGSSAFQVNETNPVSSLVTLGRFVQGLFLGGVILSAVPTLGGSAASIFIGLFLSIGFGVGFALAYMLPLIPFLKFFFGALAWLALLFEAIVAVPLLALGHLTTEGEGLPGRAAHGYMILLNLFLKPIMMIFGMIGSLMVFMIGIKMLNFGFSVALAGISGASWDNSILNHIANVYTLNMNPISILLYLIIYCILAYSIANSCFNLIDTIPEQCLRWIGGPTVSDGMDELTTLKYAAAAAGVAGTAMIKGAEGASSAKRKPKDSKDDDGGGDGPRPLGGRPLSRGRGGNGGGGGSLGSGGGGGIATQAGTNPGGSNRSGGGGTLDISGEPGLQKWENDRKAGNNKPPSIQPPSGSSGSNNGGTKT